MIVLRTLIIFLSLSLSITSTASPCSKYIIDLSTDAMPGSITINWSINTGFRGCGFNKNEILKHRYVVSIENFFGEILFKDTVNQSFVRTSTLIGDNSPMLVTIEELENPDSKFLDVIRTWNEELPPMHTKIDSLNNYLLNGYFTNALSILHDINRKDLIDEIISQHKILFPDHYPYGQRYFNCFYDIHTSKLVKMPFVDGIELFIKEINKLSKNEPKRSTGFKVYATVSTENKLSHYEVIPNTDKDKFEKLAHLLTFDNQREREAPVVIKFGRTRNQKKFTIINERALMDQDSEYFRKTFPYRGAVH